MVRSLSRYVFAFGLCMLPAACGTSRVSDALVERPPENVAAVRVVYLTSTLSFQRTFGNLVSNPQEDLGKLGFYEVGDRITKLAPAMLEKYGVKADAKALGVSDLTVVEQREVVRDYKGPERLSLLILQFRGGSISRSGGSIGSTLQLDAQLLDAPTGKTYWKGEYATYTRKTVLGSNTFDDEFVQDMLQQIFVDLEKRGFLPRRTKLEATSGPPYAALNDVDAIPYISPKGRDAYRDWLKLSYPRAFVISPSGRFYWAWGSTKNPEDPKDPTERALANCTKVASDCRAYAIDDRVVWKP
jgi:hypothetical protein